jgi:hypothetical protein
VRVGITYNVEVEEVPKVITDLLRNVTKELRIDALESLERAMRCLESSNVKKVMEGARDMDKARRALTKVDLALSDYISILEGYLGLFLEQEKKSADPLNEKEVEEPTVEEANE